MARSGLEDMSTDLVAPKLSLQRQLDGGGCICISIRCSPDQLMLGLAPPVGARPTPESAGRCPSLARPSRGRAAAPRRAPRSRAAADRRTRLDTRPSGLLPSPSLQDGGCGRPRDWRAGPAPGRAG